MGTTTPARSRLARYRAGAAALLMAAGHPPAGAADASVALSSPTPPEAVAIASEPIPAAPTNPLPPPPALEPEQNFKPRPPRDLFEAQIALMRDAVCPGSIDGLMGSQTRNALVAFQQKYGLAISGTLDNDTRAMLQLREPPLTTFTVTEADVARLRPWPKGWEAKSQLDHMDYSTVLELVAEKSWTNPNQILRLNPQITNWEQILPGTVMAMPRVFRAQPSTRPMRVLIQLSAKTMQLYDSESRLLAHFPCSIARRVEKRPVGRIEVVTSAPNPNYTFNPANFPDSEEAQAIGRKLILQPGPNNPVGVAWISLSLPGYGIHGSPEPEKIGRTESAGCFRLSNWNADYFLPLIYPGLPIDVEP